MTNRAIIARVTSALDQLHTTHFRCGRAPTETDCVYVHECHAICKRAGCPVMIAAFVGNAGLPLNAVAEAVRVGVIEAFEVRA